MEAVTDCRIHSVRAFSVELSSIPALWMAKPPPFECGIRGRSSSTPSPTRTMSQCRPATFRSAAPHLSFSGRAAVWRDKGACREDRSHWKTVGISVRESYVYDIQDGPRAGSSQGVHHIGSQPGAFHRVKKRHNKPLVWQHVHAEKHPHTSRQKAECLSFAGPLPRVSGFLYFRISAITLKSSRHSIDFQSRP
jgi:hypothetical protein